MKVLQAEYDRAYGNQPEDLRDSGNAVNTDEEIIGFVTKAAIQNGYSDKSAQSIAKSFMDCWKTEGYAVAYNRYLKALLNNDAPKLLSSGASPRRTNRYHTDEELIGLVAKAAKFRGYSKKEAQAYAQEFMNCWNTEGYVIAFNRYLRCL